jgi:uncharacterized protein YggU (UPF0235/DUF167 family)
MVFLMIIKVKVTPNSKIELLKQIGPSIYTLKVREKAIEGRANMATINALSAYFKVTTSKVSIIKGAKSKDKLIEVSTK